MNEKMAEKLTKFYDEFYLNNKSKGLRVGQVYMNALFYTDKALYDKISGTDYDPYYNDNKCLIFLDKILKE